LRLLNSGDLALTTLPIPSADALHWHAMSNLFWSTDELIGVVWAAFARPAQ
jgi:hypothetical protein